jgi:hypothetical protein
MSDAFFLQEYTIDDDRINGYKEESPEEYGCIEILNGLNIDADNKSAAFSVEFKNKTRNQDSRYFKMQMKMEAEKRKWKLESVNCSERKDGMISVDVAKKTLYADLLIIYMFM